MTYFHMGSPTLSSALSSFTSEFEMDSGGSRSLWSPGKLFGAINNPEFGKSKDVLSELCNLQLKPTKTLECYMVKPHGQLVLVSFIHY